MKQFKGFKPEAMQRIAGTLGYQGDMGGFNDYLNQNPDKMQQMGMYQQKALQMVNGGMVQNFANGGAVDPVTGVPIEPVAEETPDSLLPFVDSVGDASGKGGVGFSTADMNPIYGIDDTIVGYGPSATSGGEPTPVPVVEPTPELPIMADPREETAEPEVDPVTGTPIYTKQPIIDTPKYEGEMNYDASMKALRIATGTDEVDLQYDMDGDGKVTSNDAQLISKQGYEDGTFYTPDQYNPKAGPPKMKEGIQEPVKDESIFDAEAYMDANPDVRASYEDGGRTPYDSYIMYGKAEGKEFPINEAKLKELYPEYAEAKDEFETNKNTYREFLSEQTSTGVSGDIENIEEEYTNASKSVDQKKIEIKRLKKLAEANPDNEYYQDVLNTKVEELANSIDRVDELRDTYLDTQRTMKDVSIERLDDPTKFINEERGTKAIAVKTQVSDDQDIGAGTGQIDSVAQGVTTDGKAFDAEEGDVTEDVSYTGKEITDTAEEKLKGLEAETQDTLSKEVEAQTGTIREEGIADDTLGVSEDRIERAKKETDLVVTKEQIADVKGKNLKAIEANISISDNLKKIVAQTTSVNALTELPEPAVISEDQMAQSKAIVDAGLSTETKEIVAAKMSAFTVSDGTLALAMEGEVNALSTVQGQLSDLMKSFDNGTPAWAAGAIRAANAAMLTRGMGSSSMASAAIVQAAMESAVPIATQDAQTYAAMGMANLANRQKVSLANAAAQQGLSLQNLSNEQAMNIQNSVQAFDLQKTNLSNRQSVELANATIRATLQGKSLDNTQQSNVITAARYAEVSNLNLSSRQQAVLQDNVGELQINLANASAKQQSYITSANLAAALQGQVLTNDQQVAINTAARYSDAANLNFTSEQQVILHNSSLMQSIGLAELNSKQAATLQNAANFASMDMAELTNQQQAQVLNAQNFLQLDLANLSNEQQVSVFKAQAVQQTLLSDQASVNASKQFNATSELQVDQFNANLKTQVEQFNQAQQTAISQFNAGQENAMEQFNVAQANATDQFNAQNQVVIAQSNAVWRREVATAETAAQNRANEAAAAAAVAAEAAAYDNMWQQQADMMDNAFTAAENEADRANAYAIAQLNADADANAAAAARDAGASASLGELAGTLLTSDLSKGILGIL